MIQPEEFREQVAARLLTLKRTTLIEKMRKYGVGKQAA